MKIIVAHPAQQHSYRLATALYRKKILYKYATTVYYKKNSMTSLIASCLKGSFRTKAENRHMADIADNQVIQFCEGEGLLKLLVLNNSKLASHYNTIKYNVADRFAKKVAKYAIKNRVDAVVTYDDSSPLLFEILAKEAPNITRILDMSAANLHYMRGIYDQDTELQPEFAERLHHERALIWNDKIMDRAIYEIRNTQYFLTPSSFVEKSLAYSGVKKDQMLRCPYGVDVDQFECKTFEPIKDRPIRFIYVGGVKELKGISYLLEAFMKIPKEEAALTVVGAFNKQDEDIQPYLERVKFTGSVLHSEVSDLLKKSDVFVFPSLGDSFALSAMEAAACGLPLIVSENTGMSDLMLEGKEGFVVPIQSTWAIQKKVEWFIKNPDQIEPMGRAACELAQKYTWERYYNKIGEAVEKAVKNK